MVDEYEKKTKRVARVKEEMTCIAEKTEHLPIVWPNW